MRTKDRGIPEYDPPRTSEQIAEELAPSATPTDLQRYWLDVRIDLDRAWQAYYSEHEDPTSPYTEYMERILDLLEMVNKELNRFTDELPDR